MDLRNSPLRDWTQTHTYGKGQAIFLEGEPTNTAYQVVRGVVKYSRNSADGREVLVGLAVPGDFIDVASILDGQPYGVSAICLHRTDVELLAVTRERVLACPSLVEHLERCVLAEVRNQRATVASIALERVEVRALQALAILGQRLGQRGSGFPMLLTRQELASLIGTTTETCVRVLSTLRSEGVVQESNGIISLASKVLAAA